MQIKVNDADWGALSDADREEIRQILTKTFKADVQIVGDANAKSVMPSGSTGAPDLTGICTSLCNMAQSAAESLCNRIGNATGRQVCLIAASTAGDLCRSKC